MTPLRRSPTPTVAAPADSAPTPTVVRWYVTRRTERPERAIRLMVCETVRGWAPPERPLAAMPQRPKAPEATGWTPELVRSRLVEAFETLRLLPFDRNARPSACLTLWPDVVRDVVEAYGYRRERLRRQPSASEIQRMDEALPWLFFVTDPKQRKAVVAVALRYRLRGIGRALGCSHETIRNWERRALKAISDALNRQAAVRDRP
jgi:hypothetical protein